MSTKAINNYLVRMGIKPTVRGFRMLHDCIALVLENPNTMNQWVKEIYMPVAKKHNTTWINLEHNLRTAIDATGSKANNSEFIAVAYLILSGNL